MSGAIKATCTCQGCGQEFKRADMSKRHDTLCKACGRSKSLSLAGRGNLSRVGKSPWNTWMRRRALRQEDQWAARMAQQMADGLISDKGGPAAITAGERALVENATLARVAVLLCMSRIASDGAWKMGPKGETASPGMESLVKYLSAERQSLQALGLERRARDLPRLADVLNVKATEPKS